MAQTGAEIRARDPKTTLPVSHPASGNVPGNIPIGPTTAGVRATSLTLVSHWLACDLTEGRLNLS